MKRLMLLWQSMAADAAMRCHTCTDRDCKTVTERVRSEGESFFTITLTDFGKEFERALDQGHVGSSQFPGFRRAGGLPAFLQGFLRQIFDASSGGLLHMPSIEAIHAVRQLTLVFGKILLPCSKKRERKAVDGYVQCENDLRIVDATRFRVDVNPFEGRPHSTDHIDPGARGRVHAVDFDGRGLRHIFRLSFGNLFAGMEREILAGSLDSFMPRHGPGATADRLVGNQKYKQSEWPSRLEPYFPAGEFVFPNWRWFPNSARSYNQSWLGIEEELERDDRFEFIEPGQERPVRVVLVPKTLKTPRVIAIEPTAMQYAQQAVLGRFLKGWREDDYLHSFLGFDDQIPNQEMARQGSHDGSLATLDLSEASDRVSNLLVEFLMQDFPMVAGLFQATRSFKASVPRHGVIHLAKYASMGSAMCFPVEAMVFLTLILFGIQQRKGHLLTKRDLCGLLGKVRVYGDDIIVPVDVVDDVIRSLEFFGHKVNRSKSFWTGKFRESCGKEYYDGHDVSIVRFRRNFPSSRRHAREVISLVSFRNQLYNIGYWETCRRLDEAIVPLLKGHFPIVDSTSAVLGRTSAIYPYKEEAVCSEMQHPLVKGYVISVEIPESKLNGPRALTKFFTQGPQADLRENLWAYKDPKHLERVGRTQHVDIKLRMATPY